MSLTRSSPCTLGIREFSVASPISGGYTYYPHIKDGNGNTPAHPILVNLALGGSRHGTLILDPDGARIDPSANFLWHESPTSPNEEFEYRLGTFASVVGYVPDPIHTGQVLPYWGTTEVLALTLSTVDINGFTVQNSQSYPVRPQSGRPHHFITNAQHAGRPGDDVFEYWPDFLSNGGAELTWLTNAYYLVDQYGNATFGYGVNATFNPDPNVTVVFVDQIASGASGATWDPAGSELHVNWFAYPSGTYPVNLSLSYSDPDWSGVVQKPITIQMVRATFGTLYRPPANYDGADGTFPISVSPGATGASIGTTSTGDGKRLILMALRGTRVPLGLGGSLAENPANDPHVEVVDTETFRLSLVDASGVVISDSAFVVHRCPRSDHSGLGRGCTEALASSSSGVATLTLNSSWTSEDNRGYMGIELTTAPRNPGSYFVKLESLNQKYRIRQAADLKTDDLAAGEFKGAFALSTVLGAEFLDANFQRVDTLAVEAPITVYLRASGVTASTGSIDAEVTAASTGGDPDQSPLNVTLDRLGQSELIS